MAAGAVDQTAGETLAVVQQHFEHMQRRKLLVAVAHRERLRRLDKAARTLGMFFNIHGYSLSLPSRPESTGTASSMGSQAALTFLNRPAVASPTFAPA